jgi:formylglycine-generating enzyme required for sulfatase activity
MTAILLTRQIEHPLAAGGGPEWAAEWGEDRQFGPFAVLELPGKSGEPPVRQLFRWVPPGSFRMGSPNDEPGRWGDEGPEHWVTLSHGFWMADSPCTQELWQAVMQDNPSHFQGPTNPVERVSWKDVQGFLKQLNKRVPTMNAALPTEAQWEFACRAGSQSAIYPPVDLGRRSREPLPKLIEDILDEIAWHTGNSGYQTHPVKQKLPNKWGLYDMLGNVREWCRDGVRKYRSASCIDPVGPDIGSRCVRGGGWDSHARFVRCAYRSLLESGLRDEDLGFRLVRVQDGS